MLALKKVYGDDILRLVLVLSLLKADPSDYLETETQQLIAGLPRANGSDWSIEQEARTVIRRSHIHPKSLDNILANYERELFEELNSLGRYSYQESALSSARHYLQTYLVNNVETETTVPQIANDSLPFDGDRVSSDDNVGNEVKIDDEIAETPPDAVVTLSADFLHNRTESDIFNEIATRSFNVEDFLITPADEETEITIKKEPDLNEIYDDNAIDFVPYFENRSKVDVDPDSILDQNLSDLQDYSEIDSKDGIRNDFEYNESKQQDLEKFLLENEPLDTDFELNQMFEQEFVIDVKRERASTSFTSASSSGVSEMDVASIGDDKIDVKLEPDEGNHTGDELTQEDMDLIEVLWKQDVDMGFSVDDEANTTSPNSSKVDKSSPKKDDKLEEKERDDIEKVKASLLTDKEEDPWAGLSYIVDTETGEYILQGSLPGELVNETSEFQLLDEALQLVELGEENEEDKLQEVGESASGGDMLHPAMARHAMPHHLAHYNQSLMRSMSVEQRWQDLASLLTIPPPPEQYQYHHHHQQHPHNISAHGASGYTPNYAPLPPPHAVEKHPEGYVSGAPIDGAYKVETSHHQQHDGLYYQQSGPTEMGPTNPDGFLQSILNDEDLQLMDMAMNEGMYTMRILDGGASGHHPPPHHTHSHVMMTERDSASDSAVSSMGSERVPSLSDGEWCDAGSDSAQEYHSSKFRPYDSTYGRERAPGPQPPQKKHHMFGKRCFQEQQPQPMEPLQHPSRAHSVIKYECVDRPVTYGPEDMHPHNDFAPRPQSIHHPHMSSLQPALDLNTAHSSHALLQQNPLAGSSINAPRFAYATPERVRHNHTYSSVVQPADMRPLAGRDKRVRRLTDGSVSDGGSTVSNGQHMSRDEKRAKALGIPLEVHDIINLPMDEFNERLSKHDLSEAQLSLIRDIRRRGKNKVAAQNCRKRKLDQITSLADEVRSARDRKQRTQRDHHALQAERQRVKERFAALYRHVFQNLRDAEGRQLSSSQYSLQQAADGNVVLVPRMSHRPDQPMNRTSEDEMDRKAKSFDQ